MSASRPGNMRGPRVKTPLLLLLLLVIARLRTVSCQDYDTHTYGDENLEEPLEGEEVAEEEDTGVTDPPPDLDPDADPDPDASSPTEPTSFLSSTLSPGDIPDDPGSGDPILRSINEYGEDGSLPPPDGTDDTPTVVDNGLVLIIIVIPVALVAVIIAVICGVFMHRRLNKKVRNPDVHTEDPYFEGSSTEKVPMPMFEEDVPSVLELEMEELDQWMKNDNDTANDS